MFVEAAGDDLNVIPLAVRFEWHIDEVPGAPVRRSVFRRVTEE